MRIVSADVKLESRVDGEEMLRFVEKIGRTCYKSEDKITSSSAKEFIKKLIISGHESVLEHASISLRIICDRGVSHEIVRHRIASYSQESTRYCNYIEEKFDKQITFVQPCFWNDEKQSIWYNTMKSLEDQYFRLIELGAKPEEARTVLPNSLKTELVMTMNLRELRYFMQLRTSPAAHPQMREITKKLLFLLKEAVPVVFDDIGLTE